MDLKYSICSHSCREKSIPEGSVSEEMELHRASLCSGRGSSGRDGLGVVPLVIYHSIDTAFTSIAHLVFLQPSLIPHGEQDSANPPAEAHSAYKHILAFVTNAFQKGLSAFLLSLGQPSSSMASLLLLSPAAAGSVPSATSADVPAPLGLSEISDRAFPPHRMFCVSSLFRAALGVLLL